MVAGEKFEKNSRYTTASALPNPSLFFTSDEPDSKIYRVLNRTVKISKLIFPRHLPILLEYLWLKMTVIPRSISYKKLHSLSLENKKVSPLIVPRQADIS